MSLKQVPLTLLTVLGAAGLAGCTGQLPGSFRFLQQEQSFSSQQKVNTKIDLLWVVDNSASMDVSQEKLRNGFRGFANKYMQPTWDIQVAVITTDTYMANPAFNNYIQTTIPGSVGWGSPYITGRLATFTNPPWNSNLVNLTTGNFDSGIKYGELVPSWGQDYAKLLPGNHDGPITAFCFEAMPYFFKSVTQCQVRDNEGPEGYESCLNPDSGQDSASQCVNTVQNNTVRSGNPIIKTIPPEGVEPDETWTEGLVRDFTINITTGSAGQGSERGLASVLELLKVNEVSDSRFFRADSLRGIIFVSDEDDQSMEIPETPAAGFTPQTDYITSCGQKSVDGHIYTVSSCPDPQKLTPLEDIKEQLDDFFNALDESEPNYFVISIVALTGESIVELQKERDISDANVGAPASVAVDRGDRYIQLGQLVGNGSLSFDIGESDYSPLLDTIGKSIIDKKSTFELEREPTGAEDMIVKVIHIDGTETILSANQYQTEGKSLIVTDSDFILSLASTDEISINYQPNGAY